jgi:hypothetical protein
MKIESGEFYINKKTKEIYKIIDLAINTTNKDEGNTMVIYLSVQDNTRIYVREYDEFNEKFEQKYMDRWC